VIVDLVQIVLAILVGFMGIDLLSQCARPSSMRGTPAAAMVLVLWSAVYGLIWFKDLVVRVAAVTP